MNGGRQLPARPTWETGPERKKRHVWGRFVSHLEGYDGRYDESRVPRAPRLPEDWNADWEVP